MRPFVIGTAGHIDHGKSALVEALTGSDPDRLPEEKRRGITIELGFAHGELAPGVRAAFVDVPGHERFVRSMVAGAQGVDLALLVVGVDEGVMPQTREHADICRLLGLDRVVVAITKIDLAAQLDPEWPALVTEDIRALGPPFDAAPIVAVSARSGEGLGKLKESLLQVATALPPRPVHLPALLPIDRVFSLRGHGTVVTGTLVAGTLATGDAVEIALPAPKEVRLLDGLRVRTLQVHGRTVEQAQAGQRVAVNVPGVEVEELSSGACLGAAASLAGRSGALLDVDLELVGSARPLRNRSRINLHVGTARAGAVVDLLGRAELAPGERTVAQLRLDRAVPVTRNQRFVLRGFGKASGSGRTLAGGKVLLAAAPRRRARDRSAVEALAGSDLDAARALLAASEVRGSEERLLALQAGLGEGELQGKGLLRSGGRLFDSSAIERLSRRVAELAGLHPGIAKEEARQLLGQAVHPGAFALALERLGPAFAGGDALGKAATAGDPLAESVGRTLREARLTPPTTKELAVVHSADERRITDALRWLARNGQAIRLTDELYVDAGAARGFRERVVQAFTEREALTTLELKELAGTTRKFAIPLCEWLDRERVTLRVGDRRTLRRTGAPS